MRQPDASVGLQHTDDRSAPVASGILNDALPFGLYLAALTRIDVAKAAQYLTLIPVFGVAGAVAFLGESVSAGALGGTVVIVASLAIATRSRDESTSARVAN